MVENAKIAGEVDKYEREADVGASATGLAVGVGTLPKLPNYSVIRKLAEA